MTKQHQIVSRHNSKVKTDALDMIMSNIQENDQTTINAPTNIPFVQKYANYNSTGNRTTTSSHLNSGLRI